MSMPDVAANVPRHRVRVFVDFWNYELSMRGLATQGLTRIGRDWGRFCRVLPPRWSTQPPGTSTRG